MSDGHVKFKEAVQSFNRRFPDKAMSHKEAASKIVTEKSEKQASELFSGWCNSKRLSALKPVHIVRACQLLECEPNDLFDYE